MWIKRANCAVSFLFFRVIIDWRAQAGRRRRTCGAATEVPSFLILDRLFHIQTRIVGPRRHIEQPRLGAIRWVVPIRPALVPRQDERSLRRRRHARHALWTSFCIEPARPVHFDERFTEQELSGRSIERVTESISICAQSPFAGSALPLRVEDYGYLRGVVVEFVMRRDLVMPFEFPGIHIKSPPRAAVQIVPAAIIAIPVRTRVSNSPIRQVEIGIVSAGYPD